MHLIRTIILKVIQIDNKKLTLYTLLFIIINAALFTVVEPETFPNFGTSLWFVMVTMTTVGYGDYFPVTFLGRILGVLLFMFGIGLGGIVIGKLIDTLTIFQKRKEEGKLDYKGKNHIVIIGWTNKTDDAIKEIMASENTDVVVIDQLEKAPYLEDRVHYIQGPPANRETLRKANIEEAKACIIFADENIKDFNDRDAKTLLTASTIEALTEDLYSIVEISNQEHTENFRYNKVERFLYPQSTISHLAVQEALNPGITEVFNQLGSYQKGVNLYVVKKRDHWNTYREAFLYLLDQGATLLADGNDLNINTKLSEKIPEENRLIVVCSEEVYHNHLKM